MNTYSSYIIMRPPQHHTLQQCVLPGCKPYYDCLGDCCIHVRQRYVIAVLTAFGLMIAYLERMLAIIMTGMVVAVEVEHVKEACPYPAGNKTEIREDLFDWSIQMQGSILAAFFYGYILSHVPGALLINQIGGKHIYGLAVLLSSILAGLSPLAAEFNPWVLFALRILQGFVQGPVYPALTAVIVHWCPPEERPFMNAICNTGLPMGMVFGNAVTANLMHAVKRWDVPFYCYFVLGVVWYILWELIAAPSPFSHPFISNKEADYILESLMAEATGPTGSIPWSEMISDPAFLTAVLANLGHEFGLIFVAVEYPLFLKLAHHQSLDWNGLYSAIPWLCLWIGNFFFGELVLMLIRKGILSKVAARRIFGALALIVPAILWAVPMFIGCQILYVVLCLSVGNFFVGGIFTSVRATFIDIAPNYAGIAMSIAAGIAAISGFIVPEYFSRMIGKGTMVDDWRICFFSLCGFMFVSSIPYLFCVKAEVRPWNEGHRRK